MWEEQNQNFNQNTLSESHSNRIQNPATLKNLLKTKTIEAQDDSGLLSDSEILEKLTKSQIEAKEKKSNFKQTAAWDIWPQNNKV